MCVNQSYVWYVGYGSNLCKERFLCYICGGKFKWGGKETKRCKDKTLPKANKPLQIPHSLYFGKNSTSWRNGGVAFISPEHEPDKNNWTMGRMWEITCEQYEHVKVQEGKSWYNQEIYLGEDDGVPIHTITNKKIVTSYNKPSEEYIKTIALGLKETDNWPSNKILRYLSTKAGVKGQINRDDLIKIIRSVTSSNTSLKTY